MRGILLLLLPVTVFAAADDDPIVVLMRLRDRVLEQGERIPNRTCVETVTRDRYEDLRESVFKSCDTLLARRKVPGFAAQQRLATTDRLRLDVAFDGDREIYSWAGAKKFEDGEIDTLIPEGAMGTGPFATFLLSVFSGRAPRFVFDRDTEVGGRTLFEYSFRVSLEDSHYRHKAHDHWVTTGYTGTLTVDSETSDLVRLTVRTEELPAETGMCEVDTSMEYSKVRLTGGDFLLPSSTRQRFISREGSEMENTLAFANCRDFHSESNIRFDEAGSGAGQPAVSAPAVPAWPSGLEVSIDLVTPIDTGIAAAGDRIEGRLAVPVRSHAPPADLAPKGARVSGRLMRVEIRHTPEPSVNLSLRWESVEVDGAMVPLSLTPHRPKSPAIGDRASSTLRTRGMEFELPPRGEERYGQFHYPGEHQVVGAGLRTEWLTAQP